MTLQDVKDKREDYRRFSGLAQALKEDPSNKEPIAQSMLERERDAGRITPADFAAQLPVVLAQNYHDVLSDTVQETKRSRRDYLAQVETDYTAVLGKVSADDVKELAFLLPKVDHTDEDLEKRSKLALTAKKIAQEAQNERYDTFLADLQGRSTYCARVLSRANVQNPKALETPAMARMEGLEAEFKAGLNRGSAETYLDDVRNAGQKQAEAVYEHVGEKAQL